MGISDFKIMFSAFFLFGFLIIPITLFQALGKASIAGIITIVRQIGLFIPLILILPKIANLGIRGVFIAPPLTDLLIFILCLIMTIHLLKNLGKQKTIREKHQLQTIFTQLFHRITINIFSTT